MNEDVEVIIPWGGNCAYRSSALAYVTRRWEQLGFKVTLGVHEGPWSKALALKSVVEESTANILVVTDGDVWTDAAISGIEAIRGGASWAVPFRTIHRLNEEATSAVLAGREPGGKLAKPAYMAVPGGGIAILPTDLYRRVPMDPRFVGWGHEDESWGIALRRFGGEPRRFNSPLWHLWHPPQPRGGPMLADSVSLRNRYLRATRRRDGDLEAIISEARAALGW